MFYERIARRFGVLHDSLQPPAEREKAQTHREAEGEAWLEVAKVNDIMNSGTIIPLASAAAPRSRSAWRGSRPAC